MNILLVSNYKYIKYATVLIESVFSSCPGVPIKIYYGYNGEPREDNQILEKRVHDLGGELEWVRPALDDLKNKKNANFYALEVYGTLFPHLWLPDDIDRILYLDIDTIVRKDISDFYNIDFNGNYIAAASVKRSENGKANRVFDAEAKKKGKYFNAGMILYNLGLLREKVDSSFYSYALDHTEEFFYDQGIMNYLFCEKTLFVDPVKYNFRQYVFGDVDDADTHIIHFVTPKTPYKPWDLIFEDNEIANIVTPKRSVCAFFIDKKVNDINKIWWSYAKTSPVYDILKNEMEVKKEYVIRFGMWKRCNDGYVKYDSLKTKYAFYESREKELSGGLFFDNLSKAEKYISDTPEAYRTARKTLELSDYFATLNNSIVIISLKDTGAKYWKDFVEKTHLYMLKGIDFDYRESMICIFDTDGEVIKFDRSSELLRFNIDLSDHVPGRSDTQDSDIRLLRCTVLSQGFQKSDSSSVSKIMINNIDFSMNKIGLNIVVIDKETMCVTDSFNVNTHQDKKLMIKRTL